MAIISDNYRRIWVQNRKHIIPLSIDAERIEYNLSRLPGKKYWNFLTNSYIFGYRPKVFISYALGSPWGRKAASDIKTALDKRGVPAFLDTEDIPPGCSWHHQLQRNIAESTVFISLVDEISISRKWVIAELSTAIAGQWYAGSPIILLVKKPGFDDNPNNKLISPLINSIIFPQHKIDPSLMQIIQYKDNTPNSIAQGLTRFQSENALFTPFLSQIIWFFLNILQGVLFFTGWLGGLLIIPAIIYFVFSGADFHVPPWIQEQNLIIPLLFLFIFWGGFFLRYSIWLTFGPDQEKAKGCAVNFNLGFVLFMLTWWTWSNGVGEIWSIQGMYYFLFFSIGFLTAEYSIEFINVGEQFKVLKRQSN